MYTVQYVGTYSEGGYEKPNLSSTPLFYPQNKLKFEIYFYKFVIIWQRDLNKLLAPKLVFFWF